MGRSGDGKRNILRGWPDKNYCSLEVKILRRQNSQTLRHLKQGGQIVCLIFLHGNSGHSDRIFSDVFFAYNEKSRNWVLLNRVTK